MRANALIVASLLTRSRDPSLFLRHPSVCSCCLATTRRGDATRWANRSGLGSALLVSARRKHRFVYYCVITGACFDVTVLVWRKYATLYTLYFNIIIHICLLMFRRKRCMTMHFLSFYACPIFFPYHIPLFNRGNYITERRTRKKDYPPHETRYVWSFVYLHNIYWKN
jgi:hypothetical protein